MIRSYDPCMFATVRTILDSHWHRRCPSNHELMPGTEWWISGFNLLAPIHLRVIVDRGWDELCQIVKAFRNDLTCLEVCLTIRAASRGLFLAHGTSIDLQFRPLVQNLGSIYSFKKRQQSHASHNEWRLFASAARAC